MATAHGARPDEWKRKYGKVLNYSGIDRRAIAAGNALHYPGIERRADALAQRRRETLARIENAFATDTARVVNARAGGFNPYDNIPSDRGKGAAARDIWTRPHGRL